MGKRNSEFKPKEKKMLQVKELFLYSEFSKRKEIDEKELRAHMRDFRHYKVPDEIIKTFINDRNVADLIARLYNTPPRGIEVIPIESPSTDTTSDTVGIHV